MRFHFSKSREKPRHETNYICNTHKLLMNNNNRALAQNLLSVYKYYFWTLIPQNTWEVMKMEIYSVAIFSSINKTFYYTQTKCFRENLLGKIFFENLIEILKEKNSDTKYNELKFFLPDIFNDK